jgi:large subunit ribosomal protein L21
MLLYFVPHLARFKKTIPVTVAGETNSEEHIPMYAIIQSGGKQYKVSKGDSISVEKLNAAVGDKVKFDVLMTSDEGKVTAGTPFVSGAEVTGEVLEQYKERKLTIFRYKPKIRVRKKQGHRQPYTLIKITDIKL